MYSESDYTFCPKCGGRFKKESTTLLVCTECGLQFFINPRPVNGIILENNKEELLFVKRKFDPYLGYWDIPGGFIEINESAEDSMLREMKEEIGITITDFRYLGSYPNPYEYAGMTLHTLGIIFYGLIDNQEIKPGDDADGYAFFRYDRLPWNKIAFEAVQLGLKDYIKKIKQK